MTEGERAQAILDLAASNRTGDARVALIAMTIAAFVRDERRRVADTLRKRARDWPDNAHLQTVLMSCAAELEEGLEDDE